MLRSHWWIPIKSYSFDAELRSLQSNELLVAHFDLRWRRILRSKKVHDPETAIRDYVRARAESLSAQEPITRSQVTEDRINSVFGTSDDVCNDTIRLVWVSVRFAEIDGDLLSRAVERERMQAEAVQRERQQWDDIRHIEAFRSQVLADPGMALAYWFRQHPDVIEKKNSYEEIEELARRIAAYDPGNKWVEIAKVIQAFIDRLTPSERRQLVDSLRMWIGRHGMHDLVARLPKETDDI